MKTFIATLAGLIGVIIVAAVVVGFIFWSRVPDMLANNLSKKMLVSVKIDSMGLSWGNIDLKKLEIGNPPNSNLARAFACKEIDVFAPFQNYIKKNIVIDEIDLKDVYIGLEFDSASGPTGNWTRIMSNIQSTIQQETQTSSDRTVLIRRLVLTNIDVDVYYRKEGGKVKKLPRIDRIELTNITSEGGLPMDQVMNSVLGQMLQQVFLKQNLQNMIKKLLNAPNPLKKYVNPFKGLFGDASE